MCNAPGTLLQFFDVALEGVRSLTRGLPATYEWTYAYTSEKFNNDTSVNYNDWNYIPLPADYRVNGGRTLHIPSYLFKLNEQYYFKLVRSAVELCVHIILPTRLLDSQNLMHGCSCDVAPFVCRWVACVRGNLTNIMHLSLVCLVLQVVTTTDTSVADFLKRVRTSRPDIVPMRRLAGPFL